VLKLINGAAACSKSGTLNQQRANREALNLASGGARAAVTGMRNETRTMQRSKANAWVCPDSKRAYGCLKSLVNALNSIAGSLRCERTICTDPADWRGSLRAHYQSQSRAPPCT
jgi:hypothetical protein